MAALGQRRRDENGKFAKDHVLELWVTTTLSDEELELEQCSQKFGVKVSTVRGWISGWRNYTGTRFTGTDGWPPVTHSVLRDVIAAIEKANAGGK